VVISFMGTPFEFFKRLEKATPGIPGVVVKHQSW